MRDVARPQILTRAEFVRARMQAALYHSRKRNRARREAFLDSVVVDNEMVTVDGEGIGV